MKILFHIKYAIFWVVALFLRVIVILLRIIYKGNQRHPWLKEHLASKSTLQQISWFFYSEDESHWVSFQPSSDPDTAPRLRIATYNVLTNDIEFIDEVTKTPVRFKFTTEELLPGLDCDVICLNEVNHQFLPLLLSKTWVQRGYVVSARDSRYCRPRGNLILCRKEFAGRLFVEQMSENIPGTRQAFVAELACSKNSNFQASSPMILIASAHLTANYNYRQVREIELKRLHRAIKEVARDGVDSVFIMGDLNFHSEHENVSIPSGYVDLWTFLRDYREGYTYDSQLNPLIARKLSPERLRMRLDRVLADLNLEQLVPSSIDIFGAFPIPGEERAGIFPSDHFGLVFDIEAR